MKKKILTYLFYVFCLFVIPRTVRADSFEIYYGGTVNATVGGTVTYAVSIPVKEWNLCEYNLVIKYDTDLLEYIPDDYAFIDETVSNGVITRKFKDEYVYEGELTLLDFKAKKEYSGVNPIGVNLENVKRYDSDGEKYELESAYYNSQTTGLKITIANDKNSDNSTQDNNTTNNDDPVDENNNDSVEDEKNDNNKQDDKSENDNEKNDNDSNDDNKKNTNNNLYLYVSLGLNVVLAIMFIWLCLKKKKSA